MKKILESIFWIIAGAILLVIVSIWCITPIYIWINFWWENIFIQFLLCIFIAWIEIWTIITILEYKDNDKN